MPTSRKNRSQPQDSDEKTILKIPFFSLEALFKIYIPAMALIWGVNSFIDFKITQALDDPKVISELSQSVRPFLLFDSNGHYLKNVGCEGLIEVKVTKRDGETHLETVEITATRTLSMAPILTALPPYSLDSTIKVGPGNSWIYNVHNLIVNSTWDIKTHPPVTYRIDVIQ